ncbi:hypothetical protein [Polaribacter atrinae]|uniref:Glycosyl-hydrolase 97 N-terminal domain-containing protein n=1 Tax=Polaribacter atrinae TaxID=1333662 RepID=A0A176TGJ2_9FLAO|nr:hypothetical protein [Polaribacter atrinae]OAD46515.1 hypothetical protein LPB303_03040 [Polaribacter atrinae]
MKNKKIVLLKILLLISFVSYSQTDIITINPKEVHQNVIFGGDNKLTIKAWAEGNTNSVSSKLFKDMDLLGGDKKNILLKTLNDTLLHLFCYKTPL